MSASAGSAELAALLAALEHAPSALRRPGATVEEMREPGRVRDPDGATITAVAGTRYESVDAGGVRGELVTAPTADRRRTMLHLHGGGFVLCGLDSHRSFVSHLSAATGATILHVDYRLAPEHPFPAGLDDACAAHRWLLDAFDAPMAISGDSAGGGLAMGVVLRARDEGVPLPTGVALISPWVDLTLTAPSLRARAQTDPLLGPDNLRTMVDAYLAGHDARDPLASPRFADLAGLPPMFVLAGGREILHDDAVGLHAAALAADIDAVLHVRDDLFHVFPLFAGTLPEADEALRAIGSHLEPLWRTP
ncbi:alpha/beta hydrolase [Acidimicrobiia bacterium EGI L10123]|uniref:alpha/beta hydrolase n=1 Tax=Salinilacustrithrix flava TaxID=2957203 RepID=UPI003D7C2014|nr:alpha/beta hydrolase [Acidimicrobiia bacterium EGI L10123]